MSGLRESGNGLAFAARVRFHRAIVGGLRLEVGCLLLCRAGTGPEPAQASQDVSGAMWPLDREFEGSFFGHLRAVARCGSLVETISTFDEASARSTTCSRALSAAVEQKLPHERKMKLQRRRCCWWSSLSMFRDGQSDGFSSLGTHRSDTRTLHPNCTAQPHPTFLSRAKQALRHLSSDNTTPMYAALDSHAIHCGTSLLQVCARVCCVKRVPPSSNSKELTSDTRLVGVVCKSGRVRTVQTSCEVSRRRRAGTLAASPL